MRALALAGLTALAVGLGLTLTTITAECPTEDSTMCTWYVSSGNGQGASFTDYGLGVVHWSH